MLQACLANNPLVRAFYEAAPDFFGPRFREMGRCRCGTAQTYVEAICNTCPDCRSWRADVQIRAVRPPLR